MRIVYWLGKYSYCFRWWYYHKTGKWWWGIIPFMLEHNNRVQLGKESPLQSGETFTEIRKTKASDES